MTMGAKYTVATLCMTYNHASYIEDTLNGFIIQKTTFPIVYIIVDDNSTDGEPQLLEEWANNHLQTDNTIAWNEKSYGKLAVAAVKGNPNASFVILLLNENYYRKGRHDLKLQMVSEWYDNAKYKSICEGDDYWVDPMKLQKQVDFLEKHNDYGLVYTKARVYDQSVRKFKGTIGFESEGFSDLLMNNGIPTLTALYRSDLLDGYNEVVDEKEYKMGDKPLFLYIASKSKIHFINSISGTYRKLNTSATSRNSYTGRLAFIESSVDVQRLFASKYDQCKLPLIENNRYIYLFHAAIQFKKYNEGIQFYNKIKSPSLRLKMQFVVCKLLLFFKPSSKSN